MTRRPTRLRPALLVGALLFASLLSCGREITGLDGNGGRAGAVYLDPRFATIRLGGTGELLSIGSVVDFASVRVLLERTNGRVEVDTTVAFPPTVNEISLRFNVTLDPQAPPAGEPMDVTMKYINAAGDTVFSGGPVSVVARPSTSGTPQPAPVPIEYVGVGADAKSITITPDSFVGLRLATTAFTATVLDSSDAPLPLAPIAFTSTDSQRVHVNLRTGATSLLGARGTAKIIAQTLTGQADTAVVSITPVATAVVVVSGANQQVRQGEPFPQPIRVRAIAVDNIGVSGVVIAFTVQQGQGSVSAMLDTTDANGDAEVVWTAGDSAGVGILRAAINETAIGVNVNGTQISSAANNLTFSVQPTNITAGNAIPGFAVVVRDISGDTVSSYNSPVTVVLSGGTAGANLLGTTTTNALNGVAVFSNLTVDRGGTAYRLVASLPGVPTVPAAQSNTFNVAAAPPTAVTVIAGNGQSAPASTALADSIKVRVTDTFGYNVPGVTVTFAVIAGGGTVGPATAVTNASGVAAARWTLGPAGTQQLSATVTGLSPAIATATIPPVGGSPVLFLGVDSIGIPLGRDRTVPVFLTQPATGLTAVTLTVRDSVAEWTTGSVLIGTGGQAAYPVLTGEFVGATWAIATSAAGTDSVRVTVDSSVAVIDGPALFQVALGDTIRTLVIIDEPAPPGGLTVTVRSPDSAFVLVAPGTGLGAQEPACYACIDLRVGGAPLVNLAAPPAGTALITIPEGALTGHLVIIPIAGDDETAYPLTVEAPGYTGVGTSVLPRDPFLQLYVYEFEIGVGHQSQFEVYRNISSASDRMVQVRSLNPAVLTVDSLALIERRQYYSEQAYFRAVAPGTAQIVAEIPGLVADTQTVTVSPLRLGLYASQGVNVAFGTRTQFYAYTGFDQGGFFQYGGQAAAPIPVTMTSRDPGVLRPVLRTRTIQVDDSDAYFDVVATGAGATWLVVEAPGHLADSMLVSVSAEAIYLASNVPRLGVGLIEPYFLVERFTSGQLDVPLTLTITSDNPSVVGVLDPSVTIPVNGYQTYTRLEGRSVGTAEITASGPGIAPETFIIQVFDPAVALANFTFPQNLPPDSILRIVSTYLTDGLYSRTAADTIVAVVRSTNPAVLLVTDSIITFSPTSSSGIGGNFRPIGPGSAQLVVSSKAGVPLVPDSTAVITVLTPKLNLVSTSLSVGRGLQTLTSVTRPTSTTSVVPLAFTVQGPSGVTVAAPADSFPIGTSSRTVVVRSGNVLGTDTVIVTAPGMAPDTMLVIVAPTRASIFGAPSQLQIGQQADFVDVRLRNASSGQVQQARDTQYVKVVSRDTTILKVLSDTLRILPGASSSNYGSVRGSAPGKTYLVAQHLNGTSTVDSVLITVEPPRLFSSDYGGLVMGMLERTYEGSYYVQRTGDLTEELWVRFTSSVPALVSVPDSVVMPVGSSYATFDITSGDTTGSAIVAITADGYVPTRIPVIVTRSYLRAYQDDDIAAGGRGRVEVWRETASYSSYPSLVPIPIRITIADTTIARMVPDTATLDFDDYYHDLEWLEGIALGSTILTASDERVGEFARMQPGSSPVRIEPKRYYLSDESVMYVAPGTLASDFRYLYADAIVDTTWIQLSSVGGRFAPSVDSVRLDQYGSDYFQVRGITAGIDTLVASAAGFAPETLVVHVTAGIIRPSSTAPVNIRQGDSVQVQLSLYGPDENYVYADPGPITLTLSTTAALQTTVGGAPVTTVQVAPFSNSVVFWLKALSAGGGTLTVTAPEMTTYTINVGTRSP